MKGYVHRWLSSATQVAPFLADRLLPVLRTSAEAAAKQCVGSDGGAASQRCGFYWRNETFVDPEETDGTYGTSGAGEGLSVFAAVTSLLIADAAAPATAATSGDAGNSSGTSPSGTSQGGSPSGTADGSSPRGTAASNSGVGRFRIEITTSLLLGVMALFAWVL